MRTIKKKLLGLSMAVCALSLMGAMSSVSSPKAVSAMSDGLTMSPGAAVRLNAEDEDVAVNGLRFEAQMTKVYYDALQGTEVVLSSTAKANGKEHTVEWVLKSATEEVMTPSFKNGVAKFYHTITFDSLFGAEKAEQLKQANAFEFEANFKLDSNVDAQDWTSTTQTRSMRQVAYKAYNTPGTEEEPNAGYHNDVLLNYFSEGEGDIVFSDGITDATVSSVTAMNVYADINDSFVKVTDMKLTDLFGEGAVVGDTKEVIVFDEDNVAHVTTIKSATKILKTADDVRALCTAGQTTNGYYVLGNDISVPSWDDLDVTTTFKGTLNGNGYVLSVPQRKFGVIGKMDATAQLKNLKLEVELSVKDANPAGNDGVILGANINGSLENVYIKVVGNSNNIAKYGILLYAGSNETTKLTNVVIDYANIIPEKVNAQSGVEYRSLLGIWGDATAVTYDNVHIVSTTCNKISNTKTVNDVDGITLHSSLSDIPANTLPTQYWQADKAVWKTDVEILDSNVLWSTYDSTAVLPDGLLKNEETLTSVTDAVSGETYYENDAWTNTNALANTQVTPFVKAVNVVGADGTKIKAYLSSHNLVVSSSNANAMQKVGVANGVNAGSIIMASNVTVETWESNTSGVEFTGIFDGNGYTLTCPLRGYGIFGAKVTGAIKNVQIVINAQRASGQATTDCDVILANNLGGTTQNVAIKVDCAIPKGGVALYANGGVTPTLKNVVVDYGKKYEEVSATYEVLITLWPNVSTVVVADDVYIIATGTNMLDRFCTAENDVVADKTQVAGIRRYDDWDALKGDTSEDKDLTGFSSIYWDTTSGAPVWKVKN